MYFFNARYYDPSIGSFLQADDMLFGTNGNHAAALNRYSFSGNNPVTYSDPGGNLFWIPMIIAGAIAAAKAAAIGVATGAAISAIAYGVEYAITGEGSWEGFGMAVGIGAASGAIGGLFSVAAKAAPGAVNTLLSAGRKLSEKAIFSMSSIIGASTEGFSRSVITQQVENGTINWVNVFIDTGMSAALSRFGFRKFSAKKKWNAPIRAEATPFNEYFDEGLALVPVEAVLPKTTIRDLAGQALRNYAPDILLGAIFKRGHYDSLAAKTQNGDFF